jgi:hypothetical protein
MEVYEASPIGQRVSSQTSIGLRPIERHLDGHRTDPDDGRDSDFGRRVMAERTGKDGKKDK